MVQAITGLIGGVMQMEAAKSAEKAQTRAADKQLAVQQDVFDYIKGINKPYQDSGVLSNSILQYEMFGGQAPTVSNGGYEVGGQTYGTRAEAENALAAATERFNAQSSVKTPIFSQRTSGRDGEHVDRRLISGLMNSGAMDDRTRDNALARRGVTYKTSFDPDRGIAAAGFDPRGASITEVDPVKYSGGSLPGGMANASETLSQFSERPDLFKTLARPDERQAMAYDDEFKPGGLSFDDYMASPDYKFALSQGQNAVTSAAAAKGGLKSGATLKALMEYGQGLASTRYNDYINRQDARYDRYLSREDNLYQYQQNRDDANYVYDQGRSDIASQYMQGRQDSLGQYALGRQDNRADVFLNALMAMAGRGQVANAATQTGAMNYGQGTSEALANIGNARAASAIAQGSIGSQMVQNGFQGIASMGSGGGGMMGGMGGFGSMASQFMGGFGGGGGGFGSIGSGIY